MKDAVRKLLRDLSGHWRVGTAYEPFDLSIKGLFIEAHGFGAVAVER
jgi:hypothetical protein